MGILNKNISVSRCIIWLLFYNNFLKIRLFIILLLKLARLISFRDIFTFHIGSLDPNLRYIFGWFEITGFEMSRDIHTLFVYRLLEIWGFVETGFEFRGLVNVFNFDWRDEGFGTVWGYWLRGETRRRRDFGFVWGSYFWNLLFHILWVS